MNLTHDLQYAIDLARGAGKIVLEQYGRVERLTKTRDAVCANTEEIAGTIYKDCMSYAETSRELETDNDEYCSCSANRMAREFSKTPRLSIRYIRRLRGEAMLYCNNPRNRPVKMSSQPKTVN